MYNVSGSITHDIIVSGMIYILFHFKREKENGNNWIANPIKLPWIKLTRQIKLGQKHIPQPY